MNKPVITVKNISKSYNINHEMKASVGNVTFRDAIIDTLKKPKELLTGHIMKKEKFWALKGIDFDINKGEVIGIIGKNGSGKSTLLKIMSRITEPTTGEIVMNGRVASLLEVGTGFHPELTGRENVYFNGSILGMKKKEIDAKFDEIVAFSEVEKFLDTPVKFYSSGMYVRLAFAVAAHLDPDILIVDEVLAVGDAAFQKKCLGKMKESAAEGRTVIFVSHSIQAVKSLCTKAIWLEKGKIKNIGDVQKVANEYTNLGTNKKKSDVSKSPRTTPITGEAKITEVIISNQGDKEEIIDSKKKMYIDYKIISYADTDLKVNIHSRITFDGQPVLQMLTEYSRNIVTLKKGKNKIRCVLNPTNLNGGSYLLDCSILKLDEPRNTHIDELIGVISFNVKSYQVAKTKTAQEDSFMLTQKDAIYFADHQWLVNLGD